MSSFDPSTILETLKNFFTDDQITSFIAAIEEKLPFLATAIEAIKTALGSIGGYLMPIN